MRSLEEFPEESERTWQDLIAGWGSGWAVGSTFLGALADAVLDEPLAILECGSGLTTLVLASLARSTGASVLSLEHDPGWFAVVKKELRRFGLEANVVLAPLRSYGDFEWYDVEASSLPLFSLVVCDGPPNFAQGGRYGLVPVLGPRLASGCTILLDDAARPSERETLQRWASERGIQYQVNEAGRAFAAARVP
jgi:predicted O-methyltransferase YrrM